jgi:predicted methyltransferase
VTRQTNRVHELLTAAVRRGDTAVDATAGNGHDTIVLARLVGPTGRVFSFDLQDEAIAATAAAVASLSHVTLIRDSHANLKAHVAGPIAAATFNLGYRPGGDRTFVTRPESTVAGLVAAGELLRPGGIVTVVSYVGHAGGSDEAAAVAAFVWSLDPTQWHVDWHLEPNPRSPKLCVVRKR